MVCVCAHVHTPYGKSIQQESRSDTSLQIPN